MKGSIVIPIYNEEVVLESFFKKLYINVVGAKELEFVFVDDGSSDYSYRILKKLASEYENIKLISLDKNYGKQVAITAGMKEAEGDFVIICPVTPYNPEIAINEAIKKWQEGYDIVRAIKSQTKKQNTFQRVKQSVFDVILKFFNLKEKVLPISVIELYDRDVVDVLNALENKNMLLRNLDSWVDYSLYMFKYNPGNVQKLSNKQYLEKQKGYNKLREKEKLKKPHVEKVRAYGPSLYASLSMFAFFALSLVLLAVFYATAQQVSFTFRLFLWILMLSSLVSSALLGSRAWMIKRVGFEPYIQNDDKMYRIKEKYSSNQGDE